MSSRDIEMIETGAKSLRDIQRNLKLRESVSIFILSGKTPWFSLSLLAYEKGHDKSILPKKELP